MSVCFNLSQANLIQIKNVLLSTRYPIEQSFLGSPVLKIPNSFQQTASEKPLEWNLHTLAGRVLDLGKELQKGLKTSQIYSPETNPSIVIYFQTLQRIQSLYQAVDQAYSQTNYVSAVGSSVQSLIYSKKHEINREIDHLI